MIQREISVPDADRIDAALADAVKQPVSSLLAIQEFVDKLGGFDRAKRALDALGEPDELRKAA